MPWIKRRPQAVEVSTNTAIRTAGFGAMEFVVDLTEKSVYTELQRDSVAEACVGTARQLNARIEPVSQKRRFYTLKTGPFA